MAVCRSGGDYRHASIAPSRGASASVIQVCSLQPVSLAVMVVADMVEPPNMPVDKIQDGGLLEFAFSKCFFLVADLLLRLLGARRLKVCQY